MYPRFGKYNHANLSAGPIPLRVREAEIPIVSDAECIRKINAVTEKIFILPASSFCAGGEEGNDACQVRHYIDYCMYLLVLWLDWGDPTVLCA